MEGYNFVEGPCPPRTIIRTRQAKTTTPRDPNLPKTQEGFWGHLFQTLRRFPDAFKAVEDLLWAFHPDNEPVPEPHPIL